MFDNILKDTITDFLIYLVIFNQTVEHRKNILHATFFIIIERCWLTLLVNSEDAMEKEFNEAHTENIRSC